LDIYFEFITALKKQALPEESEVPGAISWS
jgi:hypothetical protein